MSTAAILLIDFIFFLLTKKQPYPIKAHLNLAPFIKLYDCLEVI